MNMFSHHLSFAFRNLFKSSIYSFFNIFGFALGFTICLIAGLYVYREYSVDKNFKDYQHIYRVVDAENNISIIHYDLAEKLRDRFPEIKAATPVLYRYEHEWLLKRPQKEDYITVQNMISTESDFFKIFPLDFIAGNPANPFNSTLSVVVTRGVAEKLFGGTDIVGELLTTMVGEAPISAVVEEMPENSSLKADLFINSATGITFNGICRGGNENCFALYPIYVLLNSDTDKKLLEDKINSNFPENKFDTRQIRLQPLTDIYFDKTVTDSNNLPGSRSLVYIFITVAAIILILSVINYVNFALSRQLDTLKQLGIKKAYGASFQQLRSYYVVEIGLSVILSFILSLPIGIYSKPLFEHVLGVHLNLMNIFTPVFLFSIFSVLVVVILVSSLTPFYIISKYDVQMLFGKKKTYFGKQRGKMILTGCQMAITVIMFISLFMLQKQLSYVKNYDLGFAKNHLIRIDMPAEIEKYAVFENEISQYDFVQSSVYSHQSPGFMGGAWEEQRNEANTRDVRINKIYTDIDFIKTFNLELLEGRNFTDADRFEACIISEETMREIGWDNIEGKKCNGMRVIGVVKDFNISSLHHRMEPVNIIPFKEEALRGAFLSVNIKGDVPDALNKIRHSYKKIYPGEPFNLRFYDEVFDAYYKKEERESTAIAIISFIAIIITCMGLVGQAKQLSLSKAKEIGIRKINGATIAEMMLAIPKNFLQCFAVAFVFSIPIAWYAMDKWLENFAFKAIISWWIFALSGGVVLLILTSFILWQTWKAASANPVDIIKTE